MFHCSLLILGEGVEVKVEGEGGGEASPELREVKGAIGGLYGGILSEMHLAINWLIFIHFNPDILIG